jgi:hypothetical protein
VDHAVYGPRAGGSIRHNHGHGVPGRPETAGAYRGEREAGYRSDHTQRSMATMAPAHRAISSSATIRSNIELSPMPVNTVELTAPLAGHHAAKKRKQKSGPDRVDGFANEPAASRHHTAADIAALILCTVPVPTPSVVAILRIPRSPIFSADRGIGRGTDGGSADHLARSRCWPERKLWLQLLEGSFKLIYKDKEAAN